MPHQKQTPCRMQLIPSPPHPKGKETTERKPPQSLKPQACIPSPQSNLILSPPLFSKEKTPFAVFILRSPVHGLGVVGRVHCFFTSFCRHRWNCFRLFWRWLLTFSQSVILRRVLLLALRGGEGCEGPDEGMGRGGERRMEGKTSHPYLLV